MSHSLKSLLHRDARADGASFPITELFYEPESRRLRYAALDVGGWFERREVLVALDRFGMPAEDGWPVAMDRGEIEQAPDWTDAPSAPSSLPPLVVGPFGSTFSPLLFAAQLRLQLTVTCDQCVTLVLILIGQALALLSFIY